MTRQHRRHNIALSSTPALRRNRIERREVRTRGIIKEHVPIVDDTIYSSRTLRLAVMMAEPGMFRPLILINSQPRCRGALDQNILEGHNDRQRRQGRNET